MPTKKTSTKPKELTNADKQFVKELFKNKLNDLKLWIVSGRCGDFDTKTIISIMDRYDNGAELTEKQTETIEIIHEKCNVAEKIKYFNEYEVEHLENMDIDEPPICSSTNEPINDWAIYKDGAYMCKTAFAELMRNNALTALEGKKRKFVNRTKQM